MAELFRKPVPRWFFKHTGAHPGGSAGASTPGSSLTAALAKLAGASASGSSPRAASPATSSPGPARPAPPAWPGGAGRRSCPSACGARQRVMAPDHESSYRPRLPIAVSIGPPLSVAEDEDIHEATDRIMAAICAEVARARTGYPAPRRGEDAWWVRAPGDGPAAELSPPVRRRGRRGPEAEAAPEPADRGRSPLRRSTSLPDVERRVRRDSRRGGRRPAGGEEVLEQQLRAIPFFRNLPAGALEAVAAQLQPEHHERGDVVFRQGEPGETMYLVVSGQVEVLAGADQAPLAALGPGQLRGRAGPPARRAPLRHPAGGGRHLAVGPAPGATSTSSSPSTPSSASSCRGSWAGGWWPPTASWWRRPPPGSRPCSARARAALAAAVQARAGTARVGVLELPGRAGRRVAPRGRRPPRAADRSTPRRWPGWPARTSTGSPTSSLAAAAGRDAGGAGGHRAGRAHRRLRAGAGLGRPAGARPTSSCGGTGARSRSSGWPAG